MLQTNTIPTFAQVAAKAAEIGVAFAQSGAIRETDGPNRSEQIDKMERVFGLRGVSYCEIGGFFDRFKAICYLVWPGQEIDDILLRRAKTFHEQHYGPCLTGCTDTIAAYRRLGRWKALDQGQKQVWIHTLQPGDAVIYDFSTPGNFDRHFETFIKMQTNADGTFFKDDLNRFVMVTVGFNTSADASSGSQSDGQGCYMRHRPINGTVMGSVDFNSQTVAMSFPA